MAADPCAHQRLAFGASTEGLDSDQVALLEDAIHRTGHAYLLHMLGSSPAGWLIFVGSPVLIAIVKLRNRVKGRTQTAMTYIDDKVVATIPRRELVGAHGGDLSQ